MTNTPPRRPKGRSVPLARSGKPAGPHRNDYGDVPISVTTVYGANSKDGYVDLDLGSEGAQLTIDEARMIAQWLLEAAEAAEMDTMIVQSLQDIGMGWEDAARLMLALRAKREMRMGMGVKSA